MDYRIRRQLNAVVHRQRELLFWRGLGACWLAVLLTWLGVNWAIGAGHLQASHLYPLVGGVGILGALLLLISLWRTGRNPMAVAQRIEREFPALRSRLITSLGLEIKEGESSYLEEQVVLQTMAHARRHSWGQIVPATGLAGAKIFHWLMATSFAALVLVPRNTITETPEEALLDPGVTAEQVMTVEPGDVELERGSSQLILARFPQDYVPEKTWLIIPGQAPREMSRSLDDPVFATRLEQIERDTTYRIRFAERDSRDYRIKVFEYPRLVQADAEIDYPDYTQIETKSVQDTRTVTAVEGTLLTWECRFNKAIKSAKLVDQEGVEFELSENIDDPLRGEIQQRLSTSGTYVLRLEDEQGRLNKNPPRLRIEVLPNEPPKLKLAFPGKDRDVSPLEEMAVDATVTDDFGIAQTGVSFTLAGEESQEVVLGHELNSETTHALNTLLDMEEMQAAPDQVLTYYLWADDYGPDGSIRRTYGDIYLAEVRPFEEIFRQGNQPPSSGQMESPPAGSESTRELVKLQKQILTATWNVMRMFPNPTSNMHKEDIRTIQESQIEAINLAKQAQEKEEDEDSLKLLRIAQDHMNRALVELENSLHETPQVALTQAVSAEQQAYQALLALRSHEHSIVRSSSQSSGAGSGGPSQQQFKHLELDEEENRYETQNEASNTAQTERQQQQSEIIDRLKELAQRQEDINKRLQELQASLEAAESEQQQEEIQRQLKRLREQQQEMLRDVDDLQQRLEEPENRSRWKEQREQLSNTREQLRRASDALEEGMLSRAESQGTRAQRGLDDLRQNFRRESASQFTEQARELRHKARELAQSQLDTKEQLTELNHPQHKLLRNDKERDQLVEDLQQQRQRLTELLEEMRQVTEQAETGEPLLAEKLYDAMRGVDQNKVDQALEGAETLVREGFSDQATPLHEHATDGIDQLQQSVEQAAESILGSEAEGLRRARDNLDELTRQIDQEIQRSLEAAGQTPQQQATQQQATGEQTTSSNPASNVDANDVQAGASPSANSTGQQEKEAETQRQQSQPGGQPGTQQGNRSGSQQGPNQQSPNQQNPGQQDPGQQQNPDQQSPGQGSPSRQSPGQQTPGQQSPGQSDSAPGSSSQSSSPGGNGPQSAGASSPGNSRNSAGGRSAPSADSSDSPGNGNLGWLDQFGEGAAPETPITGDDFTKWSDGLRDVQQMLENPALSEQAAVIRDRARELRLEFKRHATMPDPQELQSMVSRPLMELRDRVAEELARLENKDAPVPIDRDPVPHEFTDRVRRYYERLGRNR